MLGFVIVKRPLKLPPFLYTYYSDADTVFNRAYFPGLIRRDLVPEGKDAICVEISPRGAEQREPVNEEAMIGRIREGLVRTGLCAEDDVESIRVMEVPEAYPVYPLDYYERLRAFWSRLAPLKNLFSVGRSGQFYYNNMTRTMSLGLDLAEHLLAEDEDPPRDVEGA